MDRWHSRPRHERRGVGKNRDHGPLFSSARMVDGPHGCVDRSPARHGCLRARRTARAGLPARPATPNAAASCWRSTSAAPAMPFPACRPRAGRRRRRCRASALRSYIAGRLPNRPDLLAQWIAQPQSLVPGTDHAEHGRVAADAQRHGRLPAGAAMNAGMMQAAGPAAQTIADIGWLLIGGGTAIFVGVMVLLALRLRARRATVRPQAWIVGGGVLFPGVVLAALFAWTLPRRPRGARCRRRRAGDLGHRAHVVVGGALPRPGHAARSSSPPTRSTFPSGGRCTWRWPARDVIHSFWVPALGRQDGHDPGPHPAPAAVGRPARASTAASAPSSAASSTRGWRCTWSRSRRRSSTPGWQAQARPARGRSDRAAARGREALPGPALRRLPHACAA